MPYFSHHNLFLAILLLVTTASLAHAGVGSYFKEPAPAYGSAEWYLQRYQLQNTSPRPKTNPKDPDNLFFGFFPFWSALLVGLTCTCLLISLVGLACHLAGLRNPRTTYIKEKNLNKALMKQQLEFEIDCNLEDDYVSMTMMDNLNENGSGLNTNKLFAGSRLITVQEYDDGQSSLYVSKEYEKARKKRFLRDHL
jgi:hypothetical protein